MNNKNLQYIYDTENEEQPPTEAYSGPIMMGREREYFKRRNQEVQDFIVQMNADIEAEKKKKVDTTKQLFGISNQNHSHRISLDEKFPADMLYKVTVDNMSPYILPNTFVGIKFCDRHASGEICVYRYHGKTYCNVIKITNTKKVIAVSLNSKYAPVVLDPDDYYFIAVVSSLHLTTKEITSSLLNNMKNL